MIYVKDLSQEHQEQLQKHFKELSSEDKRSRFLGGLPDSQLEKYVQGIQKTGRVFGVFIEGQLAGVAHLIFEGEPEIALSVSSGFRKIGVGTALMDQAIAYTRAQGHPKLKIACFSNNAGMINLANKYFALLEQCDCSVHEYYISC